MEVTKEILDKATALKRPNHDDNRIPPAAIDLHLDREGFDAIDRSGQNTDEHGGIVGERGRKGNAVFASLWVKRDGPCPVPQPNQGRSI